MVRRPGAGGFENGRRDVDILHELRDLRAGFDQFGTVGQKRHAHRGLVHVALVDQAVLTEAEAVVAHVHHERRIGLSDLFEALHHAADTLVDAQQRLAIAFVEGIEVHVAVVHVVHAVPAIALLLDPGGLAPVVGLGIGHARGIVELDVLVSAQVPLGRLEHGVDRLVREVQEEGFVAVLLEPLDGVVGQLVGDMLPGPHSLAVNVELAIVVLALAPEADPFVEPRSRRVGAMAHVPLAHERGLVAELLKVLREESQTRADIGLVVDDAMLV